MRALLFCRPVLLPNCDASVRKASLLVTPLRVARCTISPGDTPVRVLPHVEGSTGKINLSYPVDWSIVRESDIASALQRMAEQGKKAGAGVAT
jgi:hypothetical protein